MRILLPICLIAGILMLPSALPVAGEEPTAVSTFDLHADTSTYDEATGDFEASGNANLHYDTDSVQADSIKGNANTKELFATNFRAHVKTLFFQGAQLATKQVPMPGPPGQYPLATYVVQNGQFTTCSKEHPDFRVTARRLSVIPEQRATMKRASVWLGNFKLMTLPKLTLKLNEHTSGESLFPRPGYNSRDGFSVTINQRLNASDRLAVILDFRETTRSGLQGGLRTNLLLGGKQSSTRAALLTDLRLRPITLPRLQNSELVRPPNYDNNLFAGQLMAFAAYDQHQRIFDIDAKELLVSTTPELGIRWITNPYHIGSTGIAAYLAGQASWGSFAEAETHQSHSRTDARMTLTTAPIPVLRNVFFQPAAYIRKSGYDNGESYGNRGVSADLSTSYGRAYILGRILNFTASGSTPFEFDDIDRFREFHTAFLYTGKRMGLGLTLRYGLDQHSLYDWEFSYTRRLHCLEPTLTWDNRFGLFRIDIKALGLD
jgi:hypothetical protein